MGKTSNSFGPTEWVRQPMTGAVVWISVLLLMVLACAASPVVAKPPDWIWGSQRSNEHAVSGVCDFRCTVQLDAPVSGRIEIACDDQYVLRLNGRLVGVGNDWKEWDAYDVSGLLKDGDNQLLVHGRNVEGPAGLALKMTVKSPRETREILTDSTWQARLQKEGTWDPSVREQTPWLTAEVAGSAGVTAPWGDGPAAASMVRVVGTIARDRLDGPLQLRDGDRIALLGGTLIERSQRFGYIESALTCAFPDRNLVFRNLGWSGDTVFGHARARFGTVEDGFAHLETQVFWERPSLVFIAYGANESFAGDAGLDEFTQGLNRLLDTVMTAGASVVMMTPIRHEPLGDPLPDPAEQNERLATYSNRIALVARERKCRLVDLFNKLPVAANERCEKNRLTHNGIHLHRRGYLLAAHTILAELGIDAPRVSLSIDAQTAQFRAEGTEVVDVHAAPGQIRFRARDSRLRIPEMAEIGTSGWRLKIQNLAPGKYELTADGHRVVLATDPQWAAGMEIDGGPIIQQSEKLLSTISRKNRLCFYRGRPQNETYLFLFRKHEQGNNAVEIPQFDPLIERIEKEIRRLSRPTLHAYEINRIE